MISNEQFAIAGTRLHQFMELLDEVPGVNAKSLSLSIEVDVGNNQIATFKMQPGMTAIHFPDLDEVFFSEADGIGTFPSQREIADAFAAYRKISEKNAAMQAAQALVEAVANNGHTYVENTPSGVIDMFLKLWSDAYGEDRPDLFLRCSEAALTGETFHTGFIKTRLDATKIAARKNEDGPDNYRPEPLYQTDNM